MYDTRSKKGIHESVLKLMKQMDFHKISIKDIAEEAKIARLTFYRNYKSKEDVLMQKSYDIWQGLFAQLSLLGGSLFDATSLHIIEHRDFLIVLSRHKLDYLFRSIFEQELASLMFKVNPNLFQDKYESSALAASISATALLYIQNETSPSKEELTSLLNKLHPNGDILVKPSRIKQKKTGLCLSGGGARGSYEIGAVMALKDAGIYQNIKHFSGASIGAANAAILATSSIEVAKEIWLTMPDNPLIKNQNLKDTLKQRTFEEGLYSMQLYEKILSSHIAISSLNDKEVYVAISESGKVTKGISELIKSSIYHFMKKDSKVHYIKLNDLDNKLALEVVKASSSIPILFPPIILENRKYYDGGVFDNTPVQPLVDAGCEEIILINIGSFGSIRKRKLNFPGVTIHEIKSKHRLGSILDFSKEHALQLIQYGYEDTMEYLKSHALDFLAENENIKKSASIVANQ